MSTSATVADDFGMVPLKPSKSLAIAEIWPLPTRVWFLPVSRAARVGEHMAVEWKRLKEIPIFATRSSVGVLISPP